MQTDIQRNRQIRDASCDKKEAKILAIWFLRRELDDQEENHLFLFQFCWKLNKMLLFFTLNFKLSLFSLSYYFHLLERVRVRRRGLAEPGSLVSGFGTQFGLLGFLFVFRFFCSCLILSFVLVFISIFRVPLVIGHCGFREGERK